MPGQGLPPDDLQEWAVAESVDFLSIQGICCGSFCGLQED